VTTPDNPFAARGVGVVYDSGRPFHHPRTLARARAALGADPVAHAVDLACGTGMSTIALREHAETVVGVDVSAEMMRAARRAPGVTYMFARAEALPFPDGTVDALTCCSGIHWFDQGSFYPELRRVLRPRGWVSLYDHYFIRVRSTPLFKAWVAELFAEFPLPPRGAAVGDPDASVPPGFELVLDEMFDDDIDMTLEQFADYQLTVSHCVAAVERGRPRSEVRAWLVESLQPMFADGETRTVRFLGSLRCLRRLA